LYRLPADQTWSQARDPSGSVTITGRRGFGEDAIYLDHVVDCRDARNHKSCGGQWRGVVSLGYGGDGKRIRKKVSGKTSRCDER
jgi:hypothetical protein